MQNIVSIKTSQTKYSAKCQDFYKYTKVLRTRSQLRKQFEQQVGISISKEIPKEFNKGILLTKIIFIEHPLRIKHEQYDMSQSGNPSDIFNFILEKKTKSFPKFVYVIYLFSKNFLSFLKSKKITEQPAAFVGFLLARRCNVFEQTLSFHHASPLIQLMYLSINLTSSSILIC